MQKCHKKRREQRQGQIFMILNGVSLFYWHCVGLSNLYPLSVVSFQPNYPNLVSISLPIPKHLENYFLSSIISVILSSTLACYLQDQVTKTVYSVEEEFKRFPSFSVISTIFIFYFQNVALFEEHISND